MARPHFLDQFVTEEEHQRAIQEALRSHRISKMRKEYDAAHLYNLKRVGGISSTDPHSPLEIHNSWLYLSDYYWSYDGKATPTAESNGEKQMWEDRLQEHETAVRQGTKLSYQQVTNQLEHLSSYLCSYGISNGDEASFERCAQILYHLRKEYKEGKYKEEEGHWSTLKAYYFKVRDIQVAHGLWEPSAVVA